MFSAAVPTAPAAVPATNELVMTALFHHNGEGPRRPARSFGSFFDRSRSVVRGEVDADAERLREVVVRLVGDAVIVRVGRGAELLVDVVHHALVDPVRHEV